MRQFEDISDKPLHDAAHVVVGDFDEKASSKTWSRGFMHQMEMVLYLGTPKGVEGPARPRPARFKELLFID